MLFGAERQQRQQDAFPFIKLSPTTPHSFFSYFLRVNFQMYFISLTVLIPSLGNSYLILGRLFVFLFLVSLANLFSKAIIFNGLP